MAMSSSYWLVAWRRSGFAMLVDPRTFVHGAGGVVLLGSISPVCALSIWALGGLILSFTCFRSPYHRPLVSGP